MKSLMDLTHPVSEKGHLKEVFHWQSQYMRDRIHFNKNITELELKWLWTYVQKRT